MYFSSNFFCFCNHFQLQTFFGLNLKKNDKTEYNNALTFFLPFNSDKSLHLHKYRLFLPARLYHRVKLSSDARQNARTKQQTRQTLIKSTAT